jgi:hypothetical protein
VPVELSRSRDVASPRLLISSQESAPEDQSDELPSGSAIAHWFRQISIPQMSCEVTGPAF